MPFKSEKQRKWMHANDPEMAKKWEEEEKMKKETKVRQLIKKMVRETMDEDFAGSYPAHVRKKFDGKRRKQSEVLGYKLTGKDDVKTEIGDATVHERPRPIKEASKRDYKDEYKKFQSSDKSKKYRAELNKYNRKKGTYGNGDGKDASHKGGKISGFEKESVNRGRKEKSRLKKEQKLTEKPLKTNPKIWVSDKFDKVIDKLPYSKLTKDNIIKLAKKFKIDKDDALRWVSYNQDVDFGLKEGKLTEAKESIFDVAAKVMKDQQNYNYKSKKGMVKLDMQTANLLTQVFKKVNPKMKKYLSKMGEDDPARMVQTLRAVAK